jgi:hypothetical protein
MAPKVSAGGAIPTPCDEKDIRIKKYGFVLLAALSFDGLAYSAY